jgi:hypothetical protein
VADDREARRQRSKTGRFLDFGPRSTIFTFCQAVAPCRRHSNCGAPLQRSLSRGQEDTRITNDLNAATAAVRTKTNVKRDDEPRVTVLSKTVQYETGLEMPPGKYHVKVVVRENQDGTFGSYETDIVVPDLKRDGRFVSSARPLHMPGQRRR